VLLIQMESVKAGEEIRTVHKSMDKHQMELDGDQVLSNDLLF
jgi:hypothetical protein